jgi:hypothetical protein
VSIFTSPQFVAFITFVITMTVSWFIRRDESIRQTASESARIAEHERRIIALERSAVTRHEFDALSERLDHIQTDLREIRSWIEGSARIGK